MSSKYAKAGVDIKKRGIEIFQETISNLFPGAFCIVTKDPHLPKYGLVTHADSAGTKPIAAYLYWRETGDTQWFKGLAQDVLAMNINDIACVGATPVNFVDYIAINPNKVPKTSLLKAINDGFKESIEILRKLGLEVLFTGGETADLPDVIRTFDISGVVNGRVELNKVVTGAKIKPGDVIIGLRSGGKTLYEEKENSGIMCNGLTLARHCLLSKEYRRKYPEISEPEGKGYQGRFKVDTYVDELQMTVGEALVSPMRFYSPIILEMLRIHGADITGLVHNMGGGMTKCLRLGTNINFVKDNIIEPDPIFHLIQRESGENWKSMFEIFNMGTGFEIIAKPRAVNSLLEISEKYGLQAKVIGKCEKNSGRNKVTIISQWGKFQYQREQ
ncbi:MAG: AIR synthase related protein [Candidatus Bathyarchaeia archaeon]|nr:phosphoribosylformylglycinamidine cyclo-ligase [Candidatus Bathyarchaeota archaeon]